MDIITLKTSDDKSFEVLYTVVKESKTIMDLISEVGTMHPIPLPTVASEPLTKAIAFYMLEADAREDFFKDIDYRALIDIICAANYLDCKTLLDAAAEALAKPIIGKQPAEILTMYGLDPAVLTPELEAQIEAEAPWIKENL